MGKIFKNISVFFLLLAGLTLSAHLLIPHDHHIADTLSNQAEKCPVSNDKSDHKSGLPIHCHAFNDIFLEKFRSFHVYLNIQSNFIAITSLSYTVSFKLQVLCESVITLQKPVIQSYALKSSPLRAPPSLA
jgi:hypothetical protein